MTMQTWREILFAHELNGVLNLMLALVKKNNADTYNFSHIRACCDLI
jgi:hypothetical protein